MYRVYKVTIFKSNYSKKFKNRRDKHKNLVEGHKRFKRYRGKEYRSNEKWRKNWRKVWWAKSGDELIEYKKRHG